MNYFITGGCGFIGSHIAEELVSEGHQVKIYDNLASGHLKNIDHLKSRVSFIQADICDFDRLKEEMKGMDYVFHEAALVSVFDSVERPFDNNAINITGTLNVLSAARENKIKRAVMASSAAIYGNEPTLPKREEMKPEPESPYALAKTVDEYYMKIFASLYGLETVTLRYFNVYGTRQDPSSMYSGVISRFVNMVIAGKTPTIFGDGLQSRDFVFVKDIVAANLLAMRCVKAGKGEVFNIASSSQTNLLDLLRILGEIEGRELKPQFREARAGDIKHSFADISRARAVLGYNPSTSITEGLKVLVAYEKNKTSC
ncbi:MAG: hypothetical protein A2268_10580 [Candidatus Raymondbacteria bacterium RifOxyA12_full_50_37]|uniref:NAD-dependent epimerase/dehydratase domain-containing protein n=1 Tax=Candidatus Raymondbacteria bacterium RIFOXYD12_FULL_49_13 TaxID=1817890 RepID=A0A1F7F8R3_UNCRA|nr:MAG: hypothetical protein A2268_10580 [Candidatus Raymondbacteria bacterium RifOxyA12_full_50_37]OGJ85410.1 MAG: hypothetical protein A2248_12365 [Candidatus Raymondbacteria bacterium RIFOXYA2_FULL_49_16]OGJ86134.1 MAG: hypothetical protein A2350_18825 [Candidatus Raymondbacteria bacterium RifOxyB12_full_50_8]OGJ94918.1 MAG: hypothetical protein A2453_07835 [Candidatus Raymondbacteria bacterium RIFOXYC2_FULL_50_21]OGJ98676.1 MAG: hypothetical protein A2487_05685 [Candidatus Raymondbacteria b